MMYRYTMTALLSATVSLAHMKMSKPAPIGSIEAGGSDYDMTAPMAGPKGGTAPYPCRGHLTDGSSMNPMDQVVAGSSYSYTIAGGANHNGGSCQIVISSDGGKSWSVIKSQIGGCLASGGGTEQVTIPKETPNGNVLFGWNWFNRSGNREMYQNCAVITVSGGGSGLSDKTRFPDPFIANLVSQPTCGTIEGVDPVFPNPGENVVYGGTYAGTTPTPGAGITGAGCGTSSGGAAPAPGAPATPSTAPGPGAPPTAPQAAPSETSAAGGAPAPSAPSQPAAGAPAPAPSAPSQPAPGAPAPSTPSQPAPGAPAPPAESGAPAQPSTPVAPAALGTPAPAGPHSCKRKRSRTYPGQHSKVARRHERLVRRSRTGRVAALPAEHISH